MLRSLFAKLVAVLATLFAVLVIAFVLLMLVATERFQQEVAQKLNRALAENILAERLLFDGERIDQDGLDHILHMMMVINPEVEIYLLDPVGRILAYSAPPGKVVREVVDLAPVRRFLQGQDRLPILGDDPRSKDQRKVFSAAPIRQGGVLQGYLYVILGGEQYEDVAQMLGSSYVLRLSSALGVAGLLMALLATALVFALLTRRLRKLIDAMKDFEETGTVQLPAVGTTRGGDDLDRLVRAFGELAWRVNAQLDKLRQTDADRRELVANVSHDLRTPLASLHGYLETLRLKDTELGPEEKRHYLEVALKHSTRLNELINELFELAKLEANDVRPHREPFSLAELVQDVLQKFRLRAEQQGIQLEHPSERENVPFVIGDIGLIERVLDNLLENALRHTPPGGRVTVALVPQSNAVTVQVGDTGCGIAEEDLPHIFDRFYTPPKQHGGNGGGAGLGLAIARRILELHGSVIHARSRLDVGSDFSFDLPTHPVTG